MARTKNRGYQQTLAPTYTARLWKMGGYIRLSREDLQKINRGLDDSNSVKNQRDILNDFHHNHIDEFMGLPSAIALRPLRIRLAAGAANTSPGTPRSFPPGRTPPGPGPSWPEP